MIISGKIAKYIVTLAAEVCRLSSTHTHTLREGKGEVRKPNRAIIIIFVCFENGENSFRDMLKKDGIQEECSSKSLPAADAGTIEN